MSEISVGTTLTTAFNVTGDLTGSLVVKTGSSATTALTLSATGNLSLATGNLTFSSTGQRITGDFSNATLSNRLAFQTSTTNGNTIVGAFPNGTGTNTRLQLFSASDPANASTASMEANATSSLVIINADKTGTGTYLPMTFYTGGSERMRLDTSGNLLVNTASSGFNAAGLPLVVGSGSGNTGMTIFSGTASSGSIHFGDTVTTGADGYRGFLNYTHSTNSMQFGTDATERMRITSGGEVYIAGTTDQGAYNLQVNGTGVWGAGAYVNGSDERLKDDITSLDSGLDVVAAMRPVTFRYKPEHSKDQSVQPGFIAQELQQAMTGKDYLDGVVQSGPEYLNVAYQNIIPILVKAMQEQQEQIKALQDKIAALEAK